MGVLSIFARFAPNTVFWAIFLGVVAGAFYAIVIPLIVSGISPSDPAFEEVAPISAFWFSLNVNKPMLAKFYFSTCIAIILARSLSETILSRLGAEIGKRIRSELFNKISDASLFQLEQIGSASLVAAINIDVSRLVAGARIVPNLLINIATLIGLLIFLAYLNEHVFILVLISILFGILVYQVPMMIARSTFEQSREAHGGLQEAIKGLIHGAKELKLDKRKKEKFFNEFLNAYEDKIVTTEKNGYTISILAFCLGNLLTFFIIGVVMFVFVNYYPIDAGELLGVVLTLLYIAGPIAVILNAIPQITVAAVSHRKIEALAKGIPSESKVPGTDVTTNWKSLRLDRITYQYPSNGDEAGFALSPISLEINRGEVLFLVGGNGSGKSTIAKLISQHYIPDSGKAYLDNQVICPDSTASLRQQMFAIYSDYYLFEKLLVEVTPELIDLSSRCLKQLKLDKKVKLVDGQFSTTALSDGQRKRLALLVGILENKNLYVFDEWAADQDLEFRDFFYSNVLPDLKRQNKAIVVISHDERYFHVADKLIKIDQGQVIRP